MTLRYCLLARRLEILYEMTDPPYRPLKAFISENSRLDFDHDARWNSSYIQRLKKAKLISAPLLKPVESIDLTAEFNNQAQITWFDPAICADSSMKSETSEAVVSKRMLFNYLIDDRTLIDIYLSRAEVIIPDSFYEHIDGDQFKQVQRAFEAILKSACTPMRVVEDECSNVSESLYNRIYGPDHVRVQHFVYLAARENRISFLKTTISYQACAINSALRAFRFLTGLEDDEAFIEACDHHDPEQEKVLPTD